MQSIKKSLSTDCIAYFNPKLSTILWVNASPVGLGAILCQSTQFNNSIQNPRPQDKFENRIIGYASRSLTDTENKYSQNKKDALAIIYGCEKFH